MPRGDARRSMTQKNAREHTVRLPEWIRKVKSRPPHETKRILRKYSLTSVCEEARCPNIGTCFREPTAAFMIMGSRCTRNCGFCAVESAVPQPLDETEPERVALAAREMGMRYVVITSVTRDDLPDGGARHFASTIHAVRSFVPAAHIEVLTPDFLGVRSHIDTLLDARPDVFNHNIETIPRLYPRVRPQADYHRSLSVLSYVKTRSPHTITKSGMILGLGERYEEVLDALRDLRNAGCDCVTIGQYLRPSRENLPVVEYVRPHLFERLENRARGMGFAVVAAGPFVRSSMGAEELYNTVSRTGLFQGEVETW